MRVDQCRERVVVCLGGTRSCGTIVVGGYRPLVRWHATGREVRVEEELLDYVAPDEATYGRQVDEALDGGETP